ncbi:MAG TPA: serine hydrolase domain-containing protein [Verrucomicrobiae bacterium]|nr:serine hydrolase domain-containing protein [Verrucomicrobiae bacterium]
MRRTLLLTIFVAGTLQAQPPESKQAQVDRIFGGFNTHTPGCAVGVAYHGEIALKAGYGMADLERNVPVTPDTVFESGSVAKQFTATALLLLAQQGKISLDDPLRKYLPEIPDYGSPLTIRQVLSHISGLREWRLVATFSGIAEGSHVLNNADLLRMAGQQKALNFTPGTAYSYTNTGFNIATILIERALGNGKTFQAFTREAIFEPLGMTHSSWRDDYRRVVPNRALAYGRAPGGGWIQETPIENIIGAGGMLTTVGDWLLWNENFAHPKVGGPDLVRELQTPATLSSGKTLTYAKGLEVTTIDGIREVAHSGSTGGYRTWLGRYPDHAVSVAVMCNSAQANPTELGRDVARLWHGATPAAKAAVNVDAASVGERAGMYRKLRDNTVIELQVRDGKLMTGGAQLIPTGAATFSAGARQFVFEGSGLRIVTANEDVVYERVQPAHPSAADLAQFAGAYTSPETGSTLTVAAKEDELTLAIAANPPVRLRPTFRDAFMMQGTAIYFRRGADGNVAGLSAGDDRAWDLRFTRVR